MGRPCELKCIFDTVCYMRSSKYLTGDKLSILLSYLTAVSIKILNSLLQKFTDIIFQDQDVSVGTNFMRHWFESVEVLALQMFKDNYLGLLGGVNKFIPSASEKYFYGKESRKNKEIEYGIPIQDFYDQIRAWTFEGKKSPFIKYKGHKIELKIV
jgi:hypothetical protein